MNTNKKKNISEIKAQAEKTLQNPFSWSCVILCMLSRLGTHFKIVFKNK